MSKTYRFADGNKFGGKHSTKSGRFKVKQDVGQRKRDRNVIVDDDHAPDYYLGDDNYENTDHYRS